MRRQVDFIVPPNTLISSPFRQLVMLNVGTLVRVGMRFRSGAHHRVFVTVSDGLFTICPAEGSDPFYGDNEIIEFGMDYPLPGPDVSLVITAWSPDTIYPHRITAWFDILEDEGQAKANFLASLQPLEAEI
jgi:hypothetical protein